MPSRVIRKLGSAARTGTIAERQPVFSSAHYLPLLPTSACQIKDKANLLAKQARFAMQRFHSTAITVITPSVGSCFFSSSFPPSRSEAVCFSANICELFIKRRRRKKPEGMRTFRSGKRSDLVMDNHGEIIDFCIEVALRGAGFSLRSIVLTCFKRRSGGGCCR